MIRDKKIIGVCQTKLNSIAGTEFIGRFNAEAVAEGYKIIIFNSPADFYYNEETDSGAKSVYSIINYDVVDAMIIDCLTFYCEELISEITGKCKERGIPVVLISGEREDCFSVLDNCTEGFSRLIEHIIADHGITDTFFMAGRRENDPHSVMRLGIYRSVLEKFGIEFSDDLVGYGEYWKEPAARELHRLYEKRGNTLPKAIICANDYMAFSVCDEAVKLGYRVPEDIIVTGFDGIPEADFFDPVLTTCRKSFEEEVRVTLDIINRALAGEITPDKQRVFDCTYYARISESCGCSPKTGFDRNTAAKQFKLMRESFAHEMFVYGWLGRMMNTSDLGTFISMLPRWLVKDSYICLNKGFVASPSDSGGGPKTSLTDTLEVLRSDLPFDPMHESDPVQFEMKLCDMVPELDNWLDDDTAFILNPISSGTEVFGYYAAKSNNLTFDVCMIDRVLKNLNVSFHTMVSYFRTRMMLISLRNAALTDHITGLPNLQGITKWFEDFSAKEENHRKCLTVSVYGLPKYKYIYENYGIEEIEEAVCTVAEYLKQSNKSDCFIGHVSEDEFMVINYYDSKEQIPPVINAATASFFGLMGEYNRNHPKDYYLEVNCGCTEAYEGWEGTLAAFSKLAGNEMYLNRLRGNKEHTVGKTNTPADDYKSFELLVEKNLFGYHFQPIIDVHSGEIYAYEALMRPDRSIGMNPAEVVRVAGEFGRLYDIEKATMFNVLNAFRNGFEKFRGRKIFINSIPGHFLNTDDYSEFVREFSNYLGYVVVELIESSTVLDDELLLIRNMMDGKTPVAIDDYGTGHSNIVNLLRYSPEIIKIDRYLVTDIHKDTNKQMFFRSTVEYARMNGIKVLAEGVETPEELDCVISLGADLIQGYYTGRPAPEPLEKISDEIKSEMLKKHSLRRRKNRRDDMRK